VSGGLQVPKAKINGLTVHYQQMGTGPDLVMIHGLYANLAFWYLSVMPVLSRDFRVTTYDLRGHGYSAMPRYGYTLRDMAADLHALFDYMGIKQAHVVGHSFGGAVGLQYTLYHPDRVSSLTLADAWIPSLQPALPRRNLLHRKLIRFRLGRVGIALPRDLPRVADSFFEELSRLQSRKGGRNSDTWNATKIMSVWNANSRVAKRWFQLMRTTSAHPELTNISGLPGEQIRQVMQPSLAIFGEYSGYLKTLRGLMKYLPNVKRVIVPRAGHLHPIVKPETFVQELKHFILSSRASS
jgi:pimeloyl-ACP methyl ester carboxylesterase